MPGLGLRYFTDLRSQLVWVPYACRRTPVHPPALEACFAGAAIDIRGDSQTRFWFNALASMPACAATSTGPAAVKHGGAVQCAQDNCAGAALCYTDTTTDPTPPPVDGTALYTVVNFGQHSADTGHATVAAYTQRVRAYLNEGAMARLNVLQRGAAPAAKLLWMDTHPFCIRNDPWVHGYRDWRTAHRLRLYNLAAQRVADAAEAGLRVPGAVVRVFDMLEPVVDGCPDGAHCRRRAGRRGRCRACRPRRAVRRPR